MLGSPSPREHLATLASFGPRIVRALWVGAVVFALGLAATATWAIFTKRQYRSEAVLSYEHGVSLGPAEGEGPRQVAARVQEMVTSRQQLETIVKKLKLYPAIVDQRNVADAVDEMRKHLTFSAREGETYRVGFDAESREVAQKGLDLLIKGVVDEDRSRRLRDADEAKKFIETERRRADDELKTKEAALSEFLARHPALAAEAATPGASKRGEDRLRGPAGSPGDVVSLEMQEAQIVDALAAAGQRAPTPGSHGGDPTLLAARDRAAADLRTAQHDLAEKQAHFTNEHPDVKAAFRHVAEMEGALRRADAALAASRDAPSPLVPAVAQEEDDGKVAALKRALAAVRAQLGIVRSRAAGPRVENPSNATQTVAIDTDFTRLNRDVSEARERQSQLESKHFQVQLVATLVSGGQGGRLIVVDPPFVPIRPVAGTRSKIAMVGGVVAMLAAVFAILLLAAFDDRLYGSRDVERVVRDAFVVVIPKLTEKGG